MRVSSSGDEQVHDSRSRLPPRRGDRGRETAVTGGDGVVDGQRGDRRWNSESRRSRSARVAGFDVTSTPKCSSATATALIAKSPSRGGRSEAIRTLVSRIAFTRGYPTGWPAPDR